MSTSKFALGAVIFALASELAFAGSESNVDPNHKFAWTENVGWTNWRDANQGADGVIIHDTFLEGFIWGENIGWINVGDGTPEDGEHYANDVGEDSGVNIDEEGNLNGLAWGENIGWINFDTSSLGDDRASFDACEHRFTGYAWGENVGWINLDDTEHFVAVGPCDFGDYDCDSDVDTDDFARFLEVFSGPDGTVDCAAFDSDEDGDVDFADYRAFQIAFTGPES